MIKKILFCVCIASHPGFAAVMEISGWDEVRARGVASLVRADVTPGDLRVVGAHMNLTRGQCVVSITYTQDYPRATRTFRQITPKNENNCWGVPNTPTSRDVALTIFNQPKSGIPLLPGSPGDLDNFTPDMCSVSQFFAVRDSVHNGYESLNASTLPGGVCRMAPSAARCEINVPSHIQHRPAYVGVVNSTEAINAEISCNRMTNVRVSVPNNVVLSQGYNEITTTISVGDAGSSYIIVSPNPTTSFKISSTIAAYTPTPGTYTGSFVLVAEWD